MATVIRRAHIERDPLLLALARKPAREDAIVPGEALDEQSENLFAIHQHAEAEPALREDAAFENAPSEEMGQENPQDQQTAALLALEAERQQVLEEAFQTGYDAGFKQGQEEGQEAAEETYAEQRSAIEERLSAFSAMIESAQASLAEGITGAEDVLVEIAFESVCRILGEALSNRPGVLAMIQTVAQCARERERLVVRVSPKDYQWIEESRDEILSRTQATALELIPDVRVALGGCLLETSGGSLDGRLETQLQNLREVLLNTRSSVVEGEV